MNSSSFIENNAVTEIYAGVSMIKWEIFGCRCVIEACAIEHSIKTRGYRVVVIGRGIVYDAIEQSKCVGC